LGIIYEQETEGIGGGARVSRCSSYYKGGVYAGSAQDVLLHRSPYRAAFCHFAYPAGVSLRHHLAYQVLGRLSGITAAYQDLVVVLFCHSAGPL
jgi:hypothetical protein